MTGFRPCPFCGSSDVSRSWQSAALVAIECASCEATGPAWKGDSTQEAKDGARDAWNTRVSPWRSLKDDPPVDGTWVTVRKRTVAGETIYACMCTNYFLVGACDWMEIPA